MKKIIKLLTIVLLMFPLLVSSKEKIKVYLFEQDGCPYCKSAKEYLSELNEEYIEYFELVEVNISKSVNNSKLMVEASEELGEKIESVPLIVIGEEYFSGFEEKTKKLVKDEIIKQYEDESSKDIVGNIIEEKGYDVGSEDSLNTGILIIFVVLVFIVGFFFMFKKK